MQSYSDSDFDSLCDSDFNSCCDSDFDLHCDSNSIRAEVIKAAVDTTAYAAHHIIIIQLV